MQPQSDTQPGPTPTTRPDPDPVPVHDRAVLEAIERELAVLLRRAARIHELRSGGRTLRLSAPSYGLLARLYEREPRRGSDLARELGLDKSTTSRHIAVLENGGLVERVGDPADGRATLVRLSAEGRRAFDENREARRQALRDLLGEWPAADRGAFARLLARLNADLGAAPRQRPAGGAEPPEAPETPVSEGDT